MKLTELKLAKKDKEIQSEEGLCESALQQQGQHTIKMDVELRRLQSQLTQSNEVKLINDIQPISNSTVKIKELEQKLQKANEQISQLESNSLL